MKLYIRVPVIIFWLNLFEKGIHKWFPNLYYRSLWLEAIVLCGSQCYKYILKVIFFEKNTYHYRNFRYIRVINDKDLLSSSYKGRNNNHHKLLSVGRNVLLHMICLLWIIELRFRLSMKIREKRKHIIVEMGRAHKRIIFRCLHHFYNGT